MLPRGWDLRDERPTAAVHPLSEPLRRVLDGSRPDPELDRLLDADSPLLRRAFRNTRGA